MSISSSSPYLSTLQERLSRRRYVTDSVYSWHVEYLATEQENGVAVRKWRDEAINRTEKQARKLFTELEMRGAGRDPKLKPVYDFEHWIEVRLWHGTELQLHIYWR